MITDPDFARPMISSVPPMEEEHLEISRLMAAATVNPDFCQMLLVDPMKAIEDGYQGETFHLSDLERYLLLFIHADSLAELACQIAQTLGMGKPAQSPTYAREPILAVG